MTGVGIYGTAVTCGDVIKNISAHHGRACPGHAAHLAAAMHIARDHRDSPPCGGPLMTQGRATGKVIYDGAGSRKRRIIRMLPIDDQSGHLSAPRSSMALHRASPALAHRSAVQRLAREPRAFDQ